jgi:hypothetical protein
MELYGQKSKSISQKVIIHLFETIYAPKQTLHLNGEVTHFTICKYRLQ